MSSSIVQKFSSALETLIDQVKRDRSILAAILCGSLSHDTVWDKSDIDLVLITNDDKRPLEESRALHTDGINVHAILMRRAEFRKMLEGSLRNSFQHSFLAKGRLLYTHDESIARLCERLHVIGERDVRVQLLNAASGAIPALYKAHKWFETRGDLIYTSLWILYAATSIAKIEVLKARKLVDREVLPEAVKLNPALFKIIYSDLLTNKKTEKTVRAALSTVDEYLASQAADLFGPVLEYLREIGEARSSSEIDDYFKHNYGIEGVTGACEYLADLGLIGKVGLPVRLTKTSNIDVEELAFIDTSGGPDAW